VAALKFEKFLKTWRGSIQENKWHRFVSIGLLLCNLFLIHGIMNKREVITLVPPNLNEEVHISESSASQGYKNAWALFVSSLVGNVTPRNIDFIVDSIGRLFAPEVFVQVEESLFEQATEIRRQNVSISFQPSRIDFSSRENLIWVRGHTEIHGARGTSTRDSRTYEVGIEIINYRPQVTHFLVFDGARAERRQTDLERQRREE
jgi:conjugal transfer pilus assembly protein TraE